MIQTILNSRTMSYNYTIVQRQSNQNPSYFPVYSNQNLFAPPQSNTTQSTQKNAINNNSTIIRIGDILQYLTYQCCGQNVFKINTKSKEIAPIQSLYSLPCLHDMCGKCIRTRFQHIKSPKISCSNGQCPYTFSTKQADQFFIRNILFEAFANKLIEFKIQEDEAFQIQKEIYAKNRILSQSKLKNFVKIQSPSQNYMQVQPPNFVQEIKKITKNQQYGIRENEIERKISRSNSQVSSGDQIFQQCVNIFCKKPTTSFFCSKKCQDLQCKFDQLAQQKINNH